MERDADFDVVEATRTLGGAFTMLQWALIFLIVAIVAGVLGFGGIAAVSAEIAQIVFFVFLVLLVASLVLHLARRGGSRL